MSQMKKRYSVLFLLFALTMIFACSRSIRSVAEVNKIIAEAGVYLDSVKNMGAQAAYPDDFGYAERKLADATDQLQKDKRDQSYTYAAESMEASKRILKKITTGQIRGKAIELKQEIEKKGSESSLRDLLPKLNEILKYVEEVETGQQQISLSSFFDNKDKLNRTEETIKKNMVQKIASDVSFKKGKYKLPDLSDEGKRILEKLVEDIIAAKDDYLKKFSGSKMIIKIKTCAYTDETPFAEGTKLVRELEDGAENIPRKQPERRQFLNQRLSEFRAETIAKYIAERISQHEDKGFPLEVKTEFIGKGETAPEGIEPPFPTDDPRRRVCNIDSHCSFDK